MYIEYTIISDSAEYIHVYHTTPLLLVGVELTGSTLIDSWIGALPDKLKSYSTEFSHNCI